MATTTVLQRTEEKPATIHPVKFENLAEQVDRIFTMVAERAYEVFEGNGRTFGHDIEDWFKAEMELLHPVHVEIAQAAEELKVKAEVPGFSEKEIEVSVEPNRLTSLVSAKPTKKRKRARRSIRSSAPTRSCESWTCRWRLMPTRLRLLWRMASCS